MAAEPVDNASSEDAKRVLLPAVLGIAFAAASFGLTAQGGALAGVSPAFEGTATLVTCAMAAALMLSAWHHGRLAKRAVFLITFVAIHIAGIGALGLVFLDITRPAQAALWAVALEAVSGCGSALLMFYWLRKLRGTSATTVSAVSFAALALGTAVTFVAGIAGPLACHVAAFALSFAQFATTRASRRFEAPGGAFPAHPEMYFGTSEERFSDRGYLAAALAGVCGVSLAAGMANAFAISVEGSAGLEFVSRLITLVLVCAAAAAVMRRSLETQERSFVANIWIALCLLLSIGAVFLSFGGPAAYIGGAVDAAVLLLLQAHIWYLSVAFSSYGKLDPYIYAAGSWIALHAFHVTGTALGHLIAGATPQNPAPAIALMGLCAVGATQIVFSQLLADPERTPLPGTAAQAAAAQILPQNAPGMLAPASAEMPSLGAAADAGAPSDVHIATSVIAMGQRFGLTGREIEVLTLYALGHTQARVSEELHLSQNTVHTHIKRIYDKCDLHSRQEILDYLNEYGG